MAKNRQVAENLALMRMAVGAAGEDKGLGWWRSAFCGSMSSAYLSPMFPRTAQMASLTSIVRLQDNVESLQDSGSAMPKTMPNCSPTMPDSAARLEDNDARLQDNGLPMSNNGSTMCNSGITMSNNDSTMSNSGKNDVARKH